MNSRSIGAPLMVALALAMAACGGAKPMEGTKEVATTSSAVDGAVAIAADPPAESPKTNALIVREFLEGELLAGRRLTDLADTDALVRDLGIPLSRTEAELEAGAPSYAVGRIDYGYAGFTLIVYRLASGGTISGGLELKAGHGYSKFLLGTPLRDYLDPDSGTVTRLDDGTYSFGSYFQDDWDLELRIAVDDAGFIRRALFLLGAE